MQYYLYRFLLLQLAQTYTNSSSKRYTKYLCKLYTRQYSYIEFIIHVIYTRRWQSKTLFLTSFDLRSSIVLTVRLPHIRCENDKYLAYYFDFY